jgi:hypothetical protein
MGTHHVREVTEAHLLIIEASAHKKVGARKQLYQSQYGRLSGTVLTHKEIYVSDRDARITESTEVVNEQVVFHLRPQTWMMDQRGGQSSAVEIGESSGTVLTLTENCLFVCLLLHSQSLRVGMK